MPQAALASAATFASASVAESTALARRTSAAFVAAATLAACAACRTSATTLGATPACQRSAHGGSGNYPTRHLRRNVTRGHGQTRMPQTRMPHTRMPHTRMPHTRMPHTRMPHTRMPHTRMPHTRHHGLAGEHRLACEGWSARHQQARVTPTGWGVHRGGYHARLRWKRSRHSVWHTWHLG